MASGGDHRPKKRVRVEGDSLRLIEEIEALALPANAAQESGGNLDAIAAAVSGSLPAGGTASAANQVTEIARLTSILAQLDVALSTRASETGNLATAVTRLTSILAKLDVPLSDLTTPADTQLVSAASLPLPLGASTSALQGTGNTSLASILAQLDVALSTRASQATVASILAQLDVALSTRASQATLALVATEATLALVRAKTDNLDVLLSTRLKPADTLAGVTTLGSITSALPAGTNLMGNVGIDQTTPGTTNSVAPISGQAGVDGGSGASTAKTVRTMSASDDPGVVSLAAILAAVTGSAASQPTFIATFSRIVPAANKYMATIFNANAARKVVIKRIWRYNWQLAAVVGLELEQELRRITARTAGTSITPAPEDTSDTLSASITADHASTAVTDSTLLQLIISSNDNTTSNDTAILTSGTALSYGALVYDAKPGTRGIVLRNGQGLTIKNITATVLGTCSYVIEFTDEVA